MQTVSIIPKKVVHTFGKGTQVKSDSADDIVARALWKSLPDNSDHYLLEDDSGPPSAFGAFYRDWRNGVEDFGPADDDADDPLRTTADIARVFASIEVDLDRFTSAVVADGTTGHATAEVPKRIVVSLPSVFPRPISRIITTDTEGLAVAQGLVLSDGEAAQERLIARWARLAVSHATTDAIADPPGFVASVVGIRGAWGFGCTREQAFEELESVLIDWASLKLDDGDDDIPSMEGVHLVIDK